MGVIRDRENSKYSTPLQVRRITKVLEGRRCPDRESVIRRWKSDIQGNAKRGIYGH